MENWRNQLRRSLISSDRQDAYKFAIINRREELIKPSPSYSELRVKAERKIGK